MSTQVHYHLDLRSLTFLDSLYLFLKQLFISPRNHSLIALCMQCHTWATIRHYFFTFNRVECTASRPISEVKQRWVWLVLGWVTAWEHQMLLAFVHSQIFLRKIHYVCCLCVNCTMAFVQF